MLPPLASPPPRAHPSQILRYTLNRRRHISADEAWRSTNDDFLELIERLRNAGPWFDRRGGADHIWIFPSGRGVSIFPDWRAHISAGLFLSPEADDRTGLMQPRGKDVVLPGYRDLSRVAPALLERVESEAVRPTLLYFRGSTTSNRSGEANYSEGVRLRLQAHIRCPVDPRFEVLEASGHR